MVQALHAVLGDTTTANTMIPSVNMLYGSRTKGDILVEDDLKRWSEMHKERFTLTHVLSQEKTQTVGIETGIRYV
jgi:NAD(P)H-flavin reductase